jgi:hypothetical protein
MGAELAVSASTAASTAASATSRVAWTVSTSTSAPAPPRRWTWIGRPRGWKAWTIMIC